MTKTPKALGVFVVERVTRIELALSAWESVSRESGNAYGVGTFRGDRSSTCNERATNRGSSSLESGIKGTGPCRYGERHPGSGAAVRAPLHQGQRTTCGVL